MERPSAEFLIETLTSVDLLALLFVCESQRKGFSLPTRPRTLQSSEWDEMVSTFSDRLSNLSESNSFEILGAHLMSVEDVDIYDDVLLRKLLNLHRPVLEILKSDLIRHPHFAVR
jgi:hypothetical protein